MSPVSRIDRALDILGTGQCAAEITRRERNPEGDGLIAIVARCNGEGDHFGIHYAPDPFDGDAAVLWGVGVIDSYPNGVLVDRHVSNDDDLPPRVLLNPDGTRRLADEPAATDTLGAPSVTDEISSVTEQAVTDAELVQEIGEIADQLARRLAHVSAERDRLARQLRDADAELTRYRTGQVAA